MKKFILPLFAFTLFVASCGNKDKKVAKTDEEVATPPLAPIDSTLVTDSSWGPITPTVDFAGLKKIYGDANVMDETICGPECADSIDVTRIYPATGDEITVYWQENKYHKAIESLETYSKRYRTTTGLKVGSTFRELLTYNGKKIIYNGFDWDYGGFIADYGGGAMEKSNLNFRLSPDENMGMELSGDSEFDTDMAETKKNLDKITIFSMTLRMTKN